MFDHSGVLAVLVKEERCMKKKKKKRVHRKDCSFPKLKMRQSLGLCCLEMRACILTSKALFIIKVTNSLKYRFSTVKEAVSERCMTWCFEHEQLSGESL